MVKNFLKNQLKYWLVVYFYSGLIFYFSSKPFGVVKESVSGYGLPFYPLVYHFLEYAVLSLLLYRALINSKFKNKCLLVIIIGILYGISDEVHQFFIPGRTFDLLDIMMNSFGIVFIMLIIKMSFIT